MEIEITWDESKRQSNIAKHGFDFARVVSAFSEDVFMEIEDCRKNYGEIRMNLLTHVGSDLLHITYSPRTIRNEDGFTLQARIISIRAANKKERQLYVK